METRPRRVSTRMGRIAGLGRQLYTAESENPERVRKEMSTWQIQSKTSFTPRKPRERLDRTPKRSGWR